MSGGSKDLAVLAATAAGALGLAAAALLDWGGKDSSLPPLPVLKSAPSSPLVAEEARALFRRLESSTNAASSNRVNPFYTKHFIPPPPKPKPKPKPPPPKPKPPPKPATRQIQLLYQGCIITSDGRKLAYVRNGKTMQVLTNGAVVAADFRVAAIALDALSLTNAQGKTNVLPFRKPATLTVPAP